MTIDEFGKALDRYGGDLDRWPKALRAEAETLTVGDATAARMTADARRLDTLLAETVEPVPVDSALIGRIVSGLDTGVRDRAAIRPTPRFAAWVGAAMIAFLSSGYAAGLALPASAGEDTFASLMFGGELAADDANGWSQL